MRLMDKGAASMAARALQQPSRPRRGQLYKTIHREWFLSAKIVNCLNLVIEVIFYCAKRTFKARK